MTISTVFSANPSSQVSGIGNDYTYGVLVPVGTLPTEATYFRVKLRGSTTGAWTPDSGVWAGPCSGGGPDALSLQELFIGGERISSLGNVEVWTDAAPLPPLVTALLGVFYHLPQGSEYMRQWSGVPGATVYWRADADEAASADKTGAYSSQASAVAAVVAIEVGTAADFAGGGGEPEPEPEPNPQPSQDLGDVFVRQDYIDGKVYSAGARLDPEAGLFAHWQIKNTGTTKILVSAAELTLRGSGVVKCSTRSQPTSLGSAFDATECNHDFGSPAASVYRGVGNLGTISGNQHQLYELPRGQFLRIPVNVVLGAGEAIVFAVEEANVGGSVGFVYGKV
jgi:hypothetical protein